MIEYHNKTIYDCKNVTKRHCTTLWTVNEVGEKVNLELMFLYSTSLVNVQVWAGNEDDCRDVTWEECNPIEKKVKPFGTFSKQIVKLHNSGTYGISPNGV